MSGFTHSAPRRGRLLLALSVSTALSSCAVGPDYVRPSTDMPAAFKEAAGSGWKQASPRDHESRGNWWEAFGDPLLNSLQEQVNISNQTIAQAEARVRQAQAVVEAAGSGMVPTVNLGLSTTRSRASATTVATPSSVPVSRGVVVNHNLPLTASWEPDLWGSIRRTVESDVAAAQASKADLEAARLLAQATLAQNYFLLRTLDAQQSLFETSIDSYRKSLQLVQNQYNAGIVSKSDLVQAQVQLQTAQAQMIDLGVQRSQLEHAIATLIGKPPSDFSIARASLAAAPPEVPPALPSDLLERRPDIAAAERRVAQANAQIGVATAAFFPALTLSASAGFQSATMAQWLTAPSRFWSFGPALAQTIFDGGLRRAQSAQAMAAYDLNVAAYRQVVLTGIQEVEDNLAALRILEEESRVQGEALRLARQSVVLTLNQYKAGTVSYLNVVTVQNTALTSERAAVTLLNQRLAASVLLIKALGGSWNPSVATARQ